MIDGSRLTGPEREVLGKALGSYDAYLLRRELHSLSETVRNDVVWRRHVLDQLLEQVSEK